MTPDDIDQRLQATLRGHARRSAAEWPAHRAKARKQRDQRRAHGRAPRPRRGSRA